MTAYVISGKLGSGKTLAAVGKIRDALNAGLPVATNLDLFPEHLLSPRNQSARILRMSDHPRLADFQAIGYGSESPDEETFGYLVLDECATWLNARQWGDKERTAIIDWLLHARKYGWHLVLMVQHPNLIDKQIRDAIIEMYGFCRRLDRIKIPFLGIRMPKVHVCAVKYGMEPGAIRAERWIYRAHDLYAAYDTRQIFKAESNHALYSMLPPWYTVGRYMPPKIGVLGFLLLPAKLLLWGMLRVMQPDLLPKART